MVRDDVHAAIERTVEFLLGVHVERRLAIDNRLADHGVLILGRFRAVLTGRKVPFRP